MVSHSSFEWPSDMTMFPPVEVFSVSCQQWVPASVVAALPRHGSSFQPASRSASDTNVVFDAMAVCYQHPATGRRARKISSRIRCIQCQKQVSPRAADTPCRTEKGAVAKECDPGCRWACGLCDCHRERAQYYDRSQFGHGGQFIRGQEGRGDQHHYQGGIVRAPNPGIYPRNPPQTERALPRALFEALTRLPFADVNSKSNLATA